MEIKISTQHEVLRTQPIVLIQSAPILKARGQKGLRKKTMPVDVEITVVQTSMQIK